MLNHLPHGSLRYPAVAETNLEVYEANAMTNEGISTQREADISSVPASY